MKYDNQADRLSAAYEKLSTRTQMMAGTLSRFEGEYGVRVDSFRNDLADHIKVDRKANRVAAVAEAIMRR